MKNLIRLVLGIGVLLAMSSVADAQPGSLALDQMQTATNPALTWAIGGPSQQQVAQTVTVGLSGALEGVMLPVVCSTGRLIIEIRALNGDAPSDVVLARRRVEAADVPAIGPPFRPIFRLFRFVDDVTFTAGDRVAIVLRNPTGSCGLYRAPAGDTYPSGEGFFQALPNGPIWIPFHETETSNDLPFITVTRLP